MAGHAFVADRFHICRFLMHVVMATRSLSGVVFVCYYGGDIRLQPKESLLDFAVCVFAHFRISNKLLKSLALNYCFQLQKLNLSHTSVSDKGKATS